MLPGSPRYLPSLIHSLVQDTGVLFPSSIFTSLLLCMVAGHKHLILRTPEEDVGEVKALVVRILVTIFGLPTQRMTLRPDVQARDFLNDVFLVAPTANDETEQRSPGASPTLHSRLSSFSQRTKPTKRRTLSRGQGNSYVIERTDSGSSIGGMDIFGSAQGTLKPFSSLDRNTSATSHTTATPLLRRGSNLRRQSTGGTSTVGRTTVGSLSPPARRPSIQSPKPSKKALLSPASDDTASTKALRPRSTHGLHIETNPPSPVTPISSLPLLSTGDYPPPSPGLLRAMSPNNGAGDVSLGRSQSPTPRLPHALVLSKLEKAKKSVQSALAEVMRTSCITLQDDDTAPDDWWNINITSDYQENEDGLGGGSWNLPVGFTVVYVCPLGDGKERPPILNSLLDKFAFSAPIRLETDAYNVSPGPFRRAALISREEIDRLQALCFSAHVSPKLQNYIASLLTAARHHPSLDGSLLTARAVTDYTDLVRASRIVLGRDERLSSGTEPKSLSLVSESTTQVLSASDADVRRMIVSGLEHRLRVRDGIGERVLGSLECTAVGEAEHGPKQRVGSQRMRSVFDVLEKENGYDAEQSSMEDRKKGGGTQRRQTRESSLDDDTEDEDERPTVQMVLQSILGSV
ncbi:hypothetical protein FRB98_008486 [Tulasnella sp. 332]|nr:hypothetical protein FRB98_008486 [Tulasnella sp. 332]